MKDAFAACGNYTELNWTTDISDAAGSDIVICAAEACQAGWAGSP